MRKLFGFFCNIMKCFLMSCGIVLLFYFFNEEVPVTKELIQRNVLVICYSLISLLCVYQITKRMFSDDDYNVITGTSLGYAKRVIRSENKNDTLTEYNRKVSSVHEAGHAVMAYLMEIESFQVILSDIQPRVVMVQKLQDANAVKKGILIKYAGAIAEEILLDKMHIGSFIVSAKYCYAAHESRLHQNDRCKRFALCLVLTVCFRSLAPWGKLFQLFI